MATGSKQQDQQQPPEGTQPEATTEGQQAAPPGGTGDYVVATDALVLRYGKDGKNVGTARRGARVRLESAIHDIEHLLRIKAVVPADDASGGTRTTAKAAALAAGGDAERINTPQPVMSEQTPEQQGAPTPEQAGQASQ